MTMDVKGITWVGNMYQKFENMCLEVEEVMLEDTVKYIENQMQTVGESVKKIYSEVMQDLLPPSSCGLDEKVAAFELPIEKYADNGLCEKTFKGSEEIAVKADTKETTEDSRVNHDVDNDAIHDESCDADALFKSASGNSVFVNNSTSHARQFIGNTDIESNLGSDENQQNLKIPASKTVTKITLLESDTCSTSQSCELSNGNQNQAVTVSNPASAEGTRLAAEAYCCEEIENASTEQISNVLVSIKSAEETEMNMSYSSSRIIFGDTGGFSMIRTIQPDDCSHNTVVVSHPEGWSLDATMIDTIIDRGHTTMQQDDELKLEETCVMVTRDELQLVPKTGSSLETNKVNTYTHPDPSFPVCWCMFSSRWIHFQCLKKKRRQPFSLSKKSARKQEYEELAILHGNNEKGKGDSVENLCPTLVEDQIESKLLLPNISEPEWELL